MHLLRGAQCPSTAYETRISSLPAFRPGISIPESGGPDVHTRAKIPPLRRPRANRPTSKLLRRTLLVGIQLVGHRRTRCIPSRTGRRIPVQLPRPEPIVDRPTTYSEPPRQLRLRDALIQVVLQQHPGLPSMHPRTVPALLTKQTERTGAPSSTSQNCAILDCQECEIYGCRQHLLGGTNQLRTSFAVTVSTCRVPKPAE